MFSAAPPPKRKTLHRVLNVELATVTNLQLPNSAQASSWQWMSQSVTWTYWQLMKWNPALLWLTRLWMRIPANQANSHCTMRREWNALFLRKTSVANVLDGPRAETFGKLRQIQALWRHRLSG